MSPAIKGSHRKSGGSESPKPEGGAPGGRRRFGSIADDLDVSKLNGDTGGGVGATPEQLEAMKQEILREMRKEVNQMKQDIIEGESFRSYVHSLCTTHVSILPGPKWMIVVVYIVCLHLLPLTI